MAKKKKSVRKTVHGTIVSVKGYDRQPHVKVHTRKWPKKKSG